MSPTTRRARGILMTALALLMLARPAVAGDATDACIGAAERGQRARLEGHLRAARAELLVCAREECPGAVASDCKRWLAEVDGAIPTAVVRAVDAQGAEREDAPITIDGAPAAGPADGRALPLDPGEHVVVAECGGAEGRVTSRFVLREGESARRVALVCPAPTPPVVSGRPIPAAAWIAGGAGVVALGAGVTLWALGLSERADLVDGCGKDGRVCAPSDETPAKTKLLAGDVAFGAGLAALGAAVWLTLDARASRVEVRPVAGGAVVGYGAAF